MSITECFRRGGVETRNYASAFALAAVLTAAALAPFAASAGSATLKCSGYTGTETLTDFQALIKLDEGRYGFSYADCADLTAGTDVWFSSDAAGNNVLEREIDTWNPDGSSYIWVKIPSLAAGMEITMHWGDAAKAQPAANTAVWTGFAGVWHMGKASGAETEPDATGHELDATPHASVHTDAGGNADLMIAAEDGIVGGSRVNTTANNIANALIVPDYKNQLDDFYKFTIGGWFYQTVPYTPGGAGGNRIFCSRPAEPGSNQTTKPNYYNGWEVASCYSSNQTDVDTKVVRVTSFKTSTAKSEFNATTTVERVVGRWVHYCVSFNRNSMKAYADGVLVNEGTIPDANLFTYVAGNGFWIGRFGNRASPFIGRYDEIRMYNGAMSADRVKADYDTVKTPTMFFCLSEPKSVTLECTGYTGTETLTDFQALIKLDEGRYGFSYAECADPAAGTDIWFSSDAAGNNVLEREIDTWNPDGSSYIWVKIPSLAAGMEITMHWGDAAKAQPAANTAVWTGYAGVWHMGKASGAETEPDMTGNGLGAKPTGTTFTDSTHPYDLSQMIPADGVVGKSRINFTANKNNYACSQGLKVSDYTGKVSDQSVFTVCGWFYASDTPNNWRMFCTRPVTGSPDDATGAGWEVQPSSGSSTKAMGFVRFRATKSGTAATVVAAKDVAESVVGRWVHVCVTWNGTEPNGVKSYVDGALLGQGTAASRVPDSTL